MIEVQATVIVPGDIPVESKADAKYVMSRDRLAQVRSMAYMQNNWRRDSARAHEYYDGNQYSSELLRRLRQRGIPPVVQNVTKRWVNSVLGMLERNQTDPLVRIEGSMFSALEMALGQRLKESERMSGADRACLDAEGDAIKGGIGWAEVTDPPDRVGYLHHAVRIPWREMYWDMTDTSPALPNASWFARAKQTKREDLIGVFRGSRCESIIEKAGTGDDLTGWFEPERLERDQFGYRDPGIWWNRSDLDLVCILEVRYRVWIDGYAFRSKNGFRLFDPDNPRHMAAFDAGYLTPEPARYRRVRQAFWIGPHCLIDRWNPTPDNEVGWVPFMCFTEDQTNVPYGLVRDMISLQDEINATKAKVHWSLDSKTVIATRGYVEDEDNLIEDVNRRDSVIFLDETAAARGARFEVDRHQSDIAGNTELMRDAIEKIGYVHGLENPLAGGRETGQSGISQQLQIDQSLTTVSNPLNHYREARQKVNKLLLDRDVQMMRTPDELTYTDENGDEQVVQVNAEMEMPNGEVAMVMVADLARQVILDDTPSTPTYRAQQFRVILESLQSMPPQAQMMMLPAMFELSDLPNRRAYADEARKMIGKRRKPRSDEEAQEMQAEQQQQQQEQELQMRGIMAKIMRDESAAGKDQATVQKTGADTQLIIGKLDELVAKIAQIEAQTEKTRAEAEQIDQTILGQDKAEAIGAVNDGYEW